ncbi:hypothetical protein HP398_07240 [Brevibacillus sp. HB1.4B]|uniref:hypothetical protein n=1 Tax=unclassified Brevibacillus TaxID=2684853 RepID=UPI00156B6EC7|nr:MULTISPECIES: hypothetical protein [unclassified Brevibacillus]NRS16227.1 hypothetical protein [Brevibacillus sp. HB1.4B]NTU29387.1 hypothetical protein [Brevibacillus sp. HB1.1]
MAERFIAGILASFLFTFGIALLYFQDRSSVLLVGMFTFPTVFLLGIPQSLIIDWVMKRLPWNKGSLLFILEAMLYIVAGIIATIMLFFIVTHTFMLLLKFYVLGVVASLLYFVCLRFLRRKKKVVHVV